MEEITINEEKVLELGDKRLTKRYNTIIKTTLRNPARSFPAIFKNWHQLKAVYRFLKNPKVTSEKLLNHQKETTINHIKALKDQNDILLLQDTTDLNYNNHTSKKDLEKTHSFIHRGLRIHPTIAITPNKINLGLLHAKIWTRPKAEDKAHDPEEKKQRPIEQKESYRWLASFQIAKEVAEAIPEKTIFNIADRQADIYELFLEAEKNKLNNCHFIVRSHHNRKTNTHDKKLNTTLENAPVLGKITFQHTTRTQPSRLVTQTIQVQEVTFPAPCKKEKLGPVKIYALLAKEENPLQDKKSIQWTIITDYPILTIQDAEKILKYYTARWEIEVFFKVLKSGCKVEKIRIAALGRLTTSLALCLIVACKIMFLLKIGREYPDLPCDVIFSRFEWQATYMATHHKKPPEKAPNLKNMIIYIAKLGGYLNRGSDPPPGPIVMWDGLRMMTALALGFELDHRIK